MILTLRAGHAFQLNISALQDLDYLRIKSLPPVRDHPCHRLIKWQSAAVLPVRSQGVEAIDRRQDAGANRNLLAGQSVWISGPIPLFMVSPHNRHYRVRKLHALQDLCADERVDLHLFEFFRTELAR